MAELLGKKTGVASADVETLSISEEDGGLEAAGEGDGESEFAED